MHLKKMVEKADEWVDKVNWLARVNGETEVECGMMVWELMARPSLEHAAEVWWPGGK